MQVSKNSKVIPPHSIGSNQTCKQHDGVGGSELRKITSEVQSIKLLFSILFRSKTLLLKFIDASQKIMSIAGFLLRV